MSRLTFSKLPTVNPIWLRVTTLSLTLFFIFLSDAVLSYWVPGLIQDTFKSPLHMGIIFSSSSAIGLLADFILPQIIRSITVAKLISLGAITSFAFIGLLLLSTSFPFLFIFLLAMAAWGLYYELIGFARQQFIADSVPLRLHAGATALLSSFKSLAYFLGPLLAGLLLIHGSPELLFITTIFTGIGALLLILSTHHHHRPMDVDIAHVNFGSELAHWTTLLKHVWPIVVLSLTTGIIDATFWTTGAILTERLATESFLGNLFLPLYTLPSLVTGLGLAKLQIFHGKKKLALKLTLGSGLILMFIGLTTNIPIILLAVLVSSGLSAISFPLIDAVYSDIVSRMGRERQHLIGLSNSSISLAYIIGPIMAGAIAAFVGEALTFSVLGAFTAITCLFLLFVTPKKIKLPQHQIKKWNKPSIH